MADWRLRGRATTPSLRCLHHSPQILLMAIGAKRKRAPAKGLPPGERLRRDKIAGAELYSQWSWVSRISDPSLITSEHLFAAYGFNNKSGKPICKNKYLGPDVLECKERFMDVAQEAEANALAWEIEDDVIIVSSDDEEKSLCDKKRCKDNSQCLNYLGQVKLEDQGLFSSDITIWVSIHELSDAALTSFLNLSRLGKSPLNKARQLNLPVGLKVTLCCSAADDKCLLSYDHTAESWSNLLCQCLHPGKTSGVLHCGHINLHLFTPSFS